MTWLYSFYFHYKFNINTLEPIPLSFFFVKTRIRYFGESSQNMRFCRLRLFAFCVNVTATQYFYNKQPLLVCVWRNSDLLSSLVKSFVYMHYSLTSPVCAFRYKHFLYFLHQFSRLLLSYHLITCHRVS